MRFVFDLAMRIAKHENGEREASSSSLAQRAQHFHFILQRCATCSTERIIMHSYKIASSCSALYWVP